MMDKGGMMHMTFYSGTHVEVLFKAWKTSTGWSYALAIIVVILAGVLRKGLLYARARRVAAKINEVATVQQRTAHTAHEQGGFQGVRTSSVGGVVIATAGVGGGSRHAGRPSSVASSNGNECHGNEHHGNGNPLTESLLLPSARDHSAVDVPDCHSSGAWSAPVTTVTTGTPVSLSGSANAPAYSSARSPHRPGLASKPAPGSSFDSLRFRLEVSAMYGLSVFLGYLLMLVAMTYNAGLFFAVVGGEALGYFLFESTVRVGQELTSQVEDIMLESDDCCA